MPTLAGNLRRVGVGGGSLLRLLGGLLVGFWLLEAPGTWGLRAQVPPPSARALTPGAGRPVLGFDDSSPSPAVEQQPPVVGPQPAHAVEGAPGQCLTLPEAIALAFRLQPRLREYLETVQQARAQQEVAFSPFLPTLSAGYSVGAFHLDVGGEGVPLPGFPKGSPAFTFLPPGGALPVGLNLDTGYELAELKLQWLLCDFGRRLGRYRQAEIAVDVAQLQTDRAFQTVANEVAVAYYQVLRARALRRTAAEAVRRGEEDLEVARKLRGQGVIEREKVLRAEVELARVRRLLDVAEEAEAVAVNALNLAIGLNVNAPACVAETTDTPPFAFSLCQCLEIAVSRRREFRVARASVQAAQQGGRVARADFAPRIVGEGYLNDFQQSSPRAHADLALGFIKLEWGLFEGGRRVAELRLADSKIRTAVAQVESIADTIAFQVNEAYHRLVAARLGIDRARPAVEQATEFHRLVRARAAQGDATPTEVTDAETALTRAQSDYLNSTYDYLTAVARLEYAMGVSPTPATLAAAGTTACTAGPGGSPGP
jgi:outer membrane protein